MAVILCPIETRSRSHATDGYHGVPLVKRAPTGAGTLQLWSTGTIRTSCGELPKDKTTGSACTKTAVIGLGQIEARTMLSGQTVNPTIGVVEKIVAKCGVVVAGNGMMQIAAKVTASFVNGRRQVGLKT